MEIYNTQEKFKSLKPQTTVLLSNYYILIYFSSDCSHVLSLLTEVIQRQKRLAFGVWRATKAKGIRLNLPFSSLGSKSQDFLALEATKGQIELQLQSVLP